MQKWNESIWVSYFIAVSYIKVGHINISWKCFIVVIEILTAHTPLDLLATSADDFPGLSSTNLLI